MKRILLISYYFQPCTGIAPNRPTAFATNFSKQCEVTVLTRHWKGDENKWEDYLRTNNTEESTEQIQENLTVVKIPYQSAIRKPNTLKTIYDLGRGHLDSEIDGLQFYQKASEIILSWKPDLIFVSAPPTNLVNLAYKLSKEFRIPYFVDFRDFQNDILLNNHAKPGRKEAFQFKVTQHHVMKWLKESLGISTINEQLQNYFQHKANKPTALIYNGFEASIFERFTPVQKLESEVFIISIIGTIYPGQELDLFLDAFQLVLEKEKNFLFKFIGIDTIPEIGDRIRKALPEPNLLITGRLKRTEALKHLEESHVVWHPEWKGYTGMYSGKIFEYLGAHRPIIIAPSVGDVLDRLLLETNAGSSFETSTEIAEHILFQYTQWKATGQISYNGNPEAIAQYSRENQSKKLLDFIFQGNQIPSK